MSGPSNSPWMVYGTSPFVRDLLLWGRRLDGIAR